MAAQKKKGKAGGKKDAKEEEEEKKEEKPVMPVKKDLDLYLPQEFAEALKEKIGLPFLFGPVEFNGLNVDNKA